MAPHNANITVNVASPPLQQEGGHAPVQANHGGHGVSSPVVHRLVTGLGGADVSALRSPALLQVKATPPPTPPRSPNALSPCGSPLPSRVKPIQPTVLIAKATPPPTPPRTPTISSPMLPRAQLNLSGAITTAQNPLQHSHSASVSSPISTPTMLSPAPSRVHEHVSEGNSLKSSKGMGKPTSLKGYLLSALSSKSSTPVASPVSSPARQRKMSEPPPMSPVDSPSFSRRLSDPLPMPLDSDKCGFLHKLAGSAYKERWFVCKNSTLYYYAKKDYASKPRGEIYLNDCEFNRDKANKRPHTLHLVHTPTKKSYYLSAGCDETLEEWIKVLSAAGAIDKDVLAMQIMLKEQEKREEQARMAKELKKKEDEYVRRKLKKRSTLRLINKNMSDGDMTTCACVLRVCEKVEEAARKEGEGESEEFRIEVTFDDQTWVIFRKYDKIVKLYDAVSKLKFVKGMCPPRRCSANMAAATFAQLQVSKLQSLLDLLVRNRPCVFASSSVRQGFLRFVAPVGWNDVKHERFVMPFQIDL